MRPSPSRSLRRLLPLAAGSLVALTALAACGSNHGPAEPTGPGTTVDRSVPAAIASLPLRDADGHPVTLDDFQGKTLVVSDSMTLCTEDCPLDTANVVAAATAADKAGLTDKTEFLTITVDPARDDRRHLTAYRKLYDPQHQLANWQLLTGSQADITRLWKYFGVYWERVDEDSPPDHDWLTGKPLTYDIAHADEVLMFDPQGHERYVISGHAHVPNTGGLPTKMRDYLSPDGVRHLLKPGDATWTPSDVLAGISWLTGHQVALTS
ncbi:MAG: SCO family protein [Nocardioides sp.]